MSCNVGALNTLQCTAVVSSGLQLWLGLGLGLGLWPWNVLVPEALTKLPCTPLCPHSAEEDESFGAHGYSLTQMCNHLWSANIDVQYTLT